VSLIELPSNQGSIIALDPHAVSAVQPYRGPIAGRGAQVFDLSTVWLHNRSIFVCAWSVEQVLDVLNTARHGEAALYAAGFREGVAAGQSGDAGEQILAASWIGYLEGRHAG
jgi:hypothetical protein